MITLWRGIDLDLLLHDHALGHLLGTDEFEGFLGDRALFVPGGEDDPASVFVARGDDIFDLGAHIGFHIAVIGEALCQDGTGLRIHLGSCLISGLGVSPTENQSCCRTQ